LSPGGSGYFTCIQNMKSVTTEFNSGGLHEKHVVATWNFGNNLNICLVGRAKDLSAPGYKGNKRSFSFFENSVM